MVAGFVFLFISVVGNVAGKIEPGKAGRIAAGVIGGILLVTGLALQMTATKIDEQGEEAEEARQAAEAETRSKEEESRRQAAEEAKAKAERAALEERARKQRHPEAEQTTVGWAIIGSYQLGSFSELVFLIDGDSPAIGRSYKATEDFRLVQKGPKDDRGSAVITLGMVHRGDSVEVLDIEIAPGTRRVPVYAKLRGGKGGTHAHFIMTHAFLRGMMLHENSGYTFLLFRCTCKRS